MDGWLVGWAERMEQNALNSFLIFFLNASKLSYWRDKRLFNFSISQSYEQNEEK